MNDGMIKDGMIDVLKQEWVKSKIQVETGLLFTLKILIVW